MVAVDYIHKKLGYTALPVKRSLASVHPSVSDASEPSDLDTLCTVWVMTIAQRGLKIKVIGSNSPDRRIGGVIKRF